MDDYIFIKASELYKIAAKIFGDLLPIENMDRAGILTLESRVREATHKNYRLDPLGWFDLENVN